MAIMKTESNEDFFAVLAAPGRSPDIPEAADAYGWLIGSWELEVSHFQRDRAAEGRRGEVHFGWVLEGRAVQDVWILPRRPERGAGSGITGNLYGTSLRVWDAAIAAWRVTWINPVSGRRNELIGRWQGQDVVQIGTHADGTPIRWIFTEISLDSFRWTGEALNPDGKTWRLEAEFRARRIPS